MRGPYYKGDAAKGTIFLRAHEYDDDSTAAQVHIVLPHSSLTTVLQVLGSGTASTDADGETQAGGLHDD